MVPTMAANTISNQTTSTADSLLREWRADALGNVIEELLCEVGCPSLTADVIARRLGVAKGSVRLTLEAVDAAIGRTLDAWERELPVPPDGTIDEPVIEVCGALFASATRGREQRAAFPCSLGERVRARRAGPSAGSGSGLRMALAAVGSQGCSGRRFRR